jgi:hypothetical protein
MYEKTVNKNGSGNIAKVFSALWLIAEFVPFSFTYYYDGIPIAIILSNPVK